MKKFNTIEEQIFDIIEKKSNIEMAWVTASHIAKLCHILGFRTSIDEVNMILGKFLFEKKIQMKNNDKLGEIFHVA